MLKKVLHHHNRTGLPYGTDLNIYKGCSHGCIYCYAKASHASRKNLPWSSFEKSTLRCEGIAETLDRELFSLSRKNNNLPVINIGGACDSYQHRENENHAMRDILEVLIRHRARIVISTKSSLIMRDIDLIDKLASVSGVNAVVTITSDNAGISMSLEPGASLPDDRFKALKELSKTGAVTGLHYFPVIPYLCDSRDTAGEIVRMAKESGCSYIMPGFLYLRGNIRPMFLHYINDKFPELKNKYEELYCKGSADSVYKKNFYKMFYSMAGRYSLCTDYKKYLPDSNTRARASARSRASAGGKQLPLLFD